MEKDDPSLARKVASAHAYAVFPSVGQGGFIVGATQGRGAVFRNGQMIGYANLKAAEVGALAGGQSFDQLILFQNEAALGRLVNQGLSFEGNASATALKAGVAASTPFRKGVAVFVKPRGGLMASLSIGGQKIDFVTTDTYAGKPAEKKTY